MQPRVAVVGLGAQGLVTVKNLLEEGFDVTGFDKNDYIGGIWHFCAEHRVSALPSTVVNVSSERACFTDFPFPKGTSSYPDATTVDRYLNDYADAFNIRPHLRLGTAVLSITRDETKGVWRVVVSPITSAVRETLEFEKLVMAIGPHSNPKWPAIGNQEAFKGEIIHSIAFKDPLHFAGKRVLIIGASNTGADTCTSLVGIASRIYMSHRHGKIVVPRFLKNGTLLDHGANWRVFSFLHTLDVYFPYLSRMVLDAVMGKITTQEFGELDPEWKFTPTPSLAHENPTVSDTLVPALRAGTITPCASPVRVLDEQTVELQDGRTVQVDAIICCTGYQLDLSILGPYNPTRFSQAHLDNPALYQNIFSLDYPDSLAFIGTVITFNPAFLMADLSSMALAQLWSSKPSSPSLPPMAEMRAWYETHLNWVAGIRASSPQRKFVKLTVRNGPWLSWVDKMAGTNVARNLAYSSIDAWRFWWNDKELCGLLLNGMMTSHVYRVFESERRKKWDGARDAIVGVNKNINEDVRKRKEARMYRSPIELLNFSQYCSVAENRPLRQV